MERHDWYYIGTGNGLLCLSRLLGERQSDCNSAERRPENAVTLQRALPLRLRRIQSCVLRVRANIHIRVSRWLPQYEGLILLHVIFPRKMRPKKKESIVFSLKNEQILYLIFSIKIENLFKTNEPYLIQSLFLN